LYGVDKVIDAELEFFANSKKRIDTCMNYTRPSLAVILEPIKKAFLDAKERGVKLRYLTEITQDNIAACKELMTIVTELRHLDGIKGNFMVSETEYLAPIILFEKGKIASEIICSDVKEILDQHKYMFDTLWNKAISAKQRIRVIDEGILNYETKVLEEDEGKKKTFKGYLENSNQLSVCTQDNRLQFVYNNYFKVIEKITEKSKNAEHKGIRWLTSIKDKDSANLAKIFLDGGVVIRHINQIPISFGVSDKEVVGSIANTEGTEMTKTLFVSNEPLYVEHFNSLFEELWKNGIDAEGRIREIEKGIAPIETRILHDQDEIIKEIKHKNNSAMKLSICTGFGGMQMSYNYLFDSYKSVVDKHKKEGGGEGDGLRWITNVNKESLNLVKIFLDSGIQIRHIKNMPPISFGVSDKEVAITIEKMEGGKMSQSFLISNEPLYINHFNSIFDELWKNGIDAEDRIRDVEVGAEWADVEVIPMSSRARDLYLNLVKKAENEIIIMFPTTNAFIRQKNLGVIQFSEEAARERDVKVRILMPSHKSTEDIVQHLKENYAECIDIRYIEKTSDTKATILVVDRKVSLVMELRDDSKRTFDEAIGLSTYSNSRPGVLSYVSIFENLWKQTELYEQLKIHDRMQQEFINVAAHELRTPIQPIISLTEVLQSQIKDVKQQEMLEVTIRNAKRLQTLTNDILDVTKIEGRSLELNKEEFNLNDVVINAMNDITLGRDFLNNEKIKLSYNPHQDILIQADKGRISQVISNLLTNAIKFTTEGTILISVEKDKSRSNNNNNNKAIIVSVKDSGQGIDSSILPRLFTKFASKSYKGTGLGLFISKGIIEAHGGKIWGQNNPDGGGATFSFSLPLEENR
jgi:two-component system, OmpR family, sensor histidine kinase VicK